MAEKEITTFEELAGAMKACADCGIRFVVFDAPGGGSWYMPFQTNGVSADDLPLASFMNDAFMEWASWFYVPVEHLGEITHFDTTNDPDEIFAGYDYENLLGMKINRLVQYV